MTRLSVEAPATSANLGPGFDALGMALDIADTITVEIGEPDGEVVLDATPDAEPDLHPHENLLCRAYRSWAEDGSVPLPGARFSLQRRIPVGKGLGSSAALIVAGLAAAAHATKTKEPAERILHLAARLEAHPDNVVAATLGGITTAFCDGGEVRALNVANHLTLGVGLFVPEGKLPTREARAALPRTVPLDDAVFNVGRATYLVTALIWGMWERIGPAMEDRLHQPHRLRLVPAMEHVIAAAREAGAYGAALSGGGPSIIALGPREQAGTFAAAMAECAARHDWQGSALVTSIRHRGVVSREI